MTEVEEMVQTIEHLQRTLEELLIRGLRACGPEQLAILDHLRQQFQEIGANYLSGKIAGLIDAMRSDSRNAAECLMRAQSTLRTFERVLTLEVAEHTLAAAEIADAENQDGREMDDDG